MQKDCPHLMTPPEELGETHQRLMKEQPDLTNEELSQYYMYATFMPPGDTKVVVSFEDIRDKTSYNLMQGVIPIRREEIVLHRKRYKKRLVVKQFKKHLSVFKDWKPDTIESLKSSLEVDFRNSRLKKFIGNDTEYDEIYSLFLDEIVRIKEIYNHSIGVSSYPYISWLEFSNLAKLWKIPDRATCSLQDIDTIFISTNFEEVEMEDNPDKYLCRYEFYEIIVRVAYQKYIKSKTSKTLPRAVARILSENIFKNSEHVLTGQQWRDDYLWSVNIDDLYKANSDSLKTIFNMFKVKYSSYINLEGAIKLCRDDLDIDIENQNIQLAFSLSKMTVVNEMEQSEKLEQLQYVEYLEFISRIAQIVFIKNKTMSLYDKIVYIMQKFFALIPAKVHHPSTDVIVESESDDDEYQ